MKSKFEEVAKVRAKIRLKHCALPLKTGHVDTATFENRPVCPHYHAARAPIPARASRFESPTTACDPFWGPWLGLEMTNSWAGRFATPPCP